MSISIKKITTLLIASFVCLFCTSTFAQNCNIEQSLKLNQRFDKCGQGASLNLTIDGGAAPFQLTIEDLNSEARGSATLSSNVANIGLYPGTFQFRTVDSNGCEDVVAFSVHPKNFRISVSDCLDNGNRAVTFSNNGSSFLPVTAEIGSVGFSVQKGASVNAQVGEGTYTVKVSTPGCSPYSVSFSVDACSNKREVEPTISQQKILIEEAGSKFTNVSVFPNPFKNELTIELNELTKSTTLIAYVYDMNGKLVHKNDAVNSIANFNLSNLQNGNYLVRLTDKNGNTVFSEQISKQ